MSAPKIILYTNRICPWAHRAHIVLAELGLPFEEVTIDLDTPREPWYLEVNPRGLVPSLSYNGEIITESAIVSQFLADAHPSHLVPPSNTPEGALQRARIAFFADTYASKVAPHYNTALRGATAEDRKAAGEAFVAAIKKEIEPLLYPGLEGKTHGPFFGGSDKLTLVEVLFGSFLIRLHAFAKPEYDLLDAGLLESLAELKNFSRWAEATKDHPSVKAIFPEKVAAERTKAKLASVRK
ncbi:glutathione S-transferase family protein [Aspergillus ibericus CBS 121593]|uniref:Thioredoxin-like protein n=1 Tax=Aspergillus ibericus CBS 121593 TaxID=1448316 RepID=A0A395GHH5_9EURO|nr:thioredoxin-like protein [Aspergillus ibericus CBS 121593]RAK94849.1 thioredoxin-like protein [Aspergillus ibericus CBS 121593]